jgi:type VI secretion system protein ImpF
MAEHTTQERLQPALLDRLTDEEPGQGQESRDRRVLSLGRLREAVLRDLAWLLNTTRFDVSEELSDYPLVARSTLNFGIPELTGTAVSGLDAAALAGLLRECIWNYEPRIRRDSLQVRVVHAPDETNHRSVEFQIEGELMAQPMPLQLYLKTEIDLQSGSAVVLDAR